MTHKPKTVLIVDDDEGMRDTLTAILKRDYRVLRVSNGEAALPILNREDVDIMLLDVRLPGISGFEVLRIVKENYSLVEVIIISAISEVETAVQAMKHGAYHYITKDFDYDTMRSLVRNALERQDLNRQVLTLSAQIADQGDREFVVGPSQAGREIIDLEKAVKDGRFREDLYYRVNVIPIKLPPLRERPEDIPELARFFLRRYSARFHKRVEGIAESTMRILCNYWWPGNIRELENLIERLIAVGDKEWITDEDLPFEFHLAQLDNAESSASSESLFQEATNTFERNFILRALERSGWNVTATARYLGIPLSTLKFKMDRLEIRELARRLRGA